MTSHRERGRRSDCPVNVAVEILGDPWSLLIIRDLMMAGRHTYNDFLDADEGIASSVLAERLRRLGTAQLIEKRPDPDDARRWVYCLTDKGMDLASVLIELILWSARHEQTNAHPHDIQEMTFRRHDVIARWRQQRQRV